MHHARLQLRPSAICLLATVLLVLGEMDGPPPFVDRIINPPSTFNDPADSSPEAFYDHAVQKALTHTHRWKRRSREVYNVLFLTTLPDYVQRMSRDYYDLAESAERHPKVHFGLWGPGFQDWDTSVSYGRNLQQKYDCKIDILYFYGGALSLRVHNRTNLEPCTSQMTIIEELPDCHYYDCIKDAHPSDILIARYGFIPTELFDMRDPQSPSFSRDISVRMVAHSPQCVATDKVQPRAFQEKSGKALLIGSIHKSLYPLRYKIQQGINSSLITSVEIYQHPGYRLPKLRGGSNTYNKTSEVSIRGNKQYMDFTRALSTAYICVFDSSVVKKAIRKYMESMMAGCVVAADIPFDMLGTMHDLLIPLSVDMSEQEIETTIHNHLLDARNLQELAGRGIHFALEHFTCDARMDRMLDIYEEFKHGYKGYYLPYGF